jgi:hypothetical protein
MFTGAFVISVIFVMSETRSSIILARIAKDTRKMTGDPRYQSSAEVDKPSMSSLIKTSCTRPLYLLLTEPIVQSFSLWCGFVWGIVFCLFESVTTEFQSVYNFSVGDTGFVLLCQSVGAILGFMVNMYQETLYQKYFPIKRQEARLYMPCVAAIVLPVSMFIYAWTASFNIPWIVPLIGLTAFMTGTSVIYQVTFLYLADCYGPYTSSAQAGQSLARNIMALMFPLFTQQMFAGMTYKWGLTLWALLSVAMASTPWVLFFHGSKIRSRSKVSRKILEAEQQEWDGDTPVAASPVEKKSMQA